MGSFLTSGIVVCFIVYICFRVGGEFVVCGFTLLIYVANFNVRLLFVIVTLVPSSRFFCPVVMVMCRCS